MNKKIFQYSVLKYKHSILLNEILNVGLLVYFKDINTINFIYPTKLNRISHLYFDFNIGIIKSIQSIFEKKCNEINFAAHNQTTGLFKSELKNISLKELINSDFIVEDASSLYFDEIKTGVNIGVESILEYYKREYFSCYEEKQIHPNKKDEKYLEQKLKQQLKNISFNYQSIEINKDITVSGYSERFKWGWKNGTENLIAPIGLDLLEPDSINQKAITWYGKLNYFNDYAKENNVSFHIITSKPTEKKLFKAYDNALKVIDKASTSKIIYEEEKIEEYSKYISKNITGII